MDDKEGIKGDLMKALALVFALALVGCASYESTDHFREYMSYMIDSSYQMVYPGTGEEFAEFKKQHAHEYKYRPLVNAQKSMLLTKRSTAKEARENMAEITDRIYLHLSADEINACAKDTPYEWELCLVEALNAKIMARINEKYEATYAAHSSDRRRVAGSALSGFSQAIGRQTASGAPRIQTGSCSSDFECGAHQACGSKNSYGQGTCMDVVNQYNQTNYGYQKSFGVKKVEECPPSGCR